MQQEINWSGLLSSPFTNVTGLKITCCILYANGRPILPDLVMLLVEKVMRCAAKISAICDPSVSDRENTDIDKVRDGCITFTFFTAKMIG